MITVYRSEHYLEFTLNPDGGILYVREKGVQEVCERDGLSMDQAKAVLCEVREEMGGQLVSTPARTGADRS